MKKLILISSLLAAGTMMADAATLTYVGGYDSFASGTELADKLLETDTAGTNTLSAMLTGTSDTLTVSSSSAALALSGGKNAFGFMTSTDTVYDGVLFVMTFDSITAATQTLFSFQLNGYGINFVLSGTDITTMSLGINFCGSSTAAGAVYTIGSADFSASESSPLTIAIGYQRGTSVGGFMYVNDTLATDNLALKIGGNISCNNGSTEQPMLIGNSQIVLSTNCPAGNFTLDNFYAYKLTSSAITAEQCSALVSAANLRAIPEPSMFGLLAGTLALGLAGTRRRRRKS